MELADPKNYIQVPNWMIGNLMSLADDSVGRLFSDR